MTKKEYAYWLADKIPAYGDYAKESAQVLVRQADEIERLQQRIKEMEATAQQHAKALDTIHEINAARGYKEG